MNGLGWQIKGKVADWLVTNASSGLEQLLELLLVAAVGKWSTSGYSSFDHTENSLTVRLFAHCLEVGRARQFALLSVSWEAPFPSQEILDGLTAPAQSGRPDMTVRVGNGRHIHIEAKRLDGTATLSKQYVTQGMKRFWDHYYAGHPGVMLAYLQGINHGSAVQGVNSELVAEYSQMNSIVPGSSAGHSLLSSPQGLAGDLAKSRSTHPGEVVIEHYALQV